MQERTEELFAEYIARVQGGEALEFEAFCKGFPEVAGDLRELLELWLQAAALVQRHAHSATVVEEAVSILGASVDPGVELEREQDAPVGIEPVLASIRDRRAPVARYRIKDKLGQGAMGVVFRAWDVELKRHVAMKVIRGRDSEMRWPGFSALTPARVGRFLEEAQVTAQLDHPSIVPVHDIGFDGEGRIYYTMRWVRGRNLERLFELAKRGEEGWTQTRLLGVLLRVCEAIGYAHDKGVVHRDLKPSNVMVGRFGEVCVMDWGLARVMRAAEGAHSSASAAVQSDRRKSAAAQRDAATKHGSAVGTPAYMSPEQSLGRLDEIGPASDVYSMGAMLWQLLAGRLPPAPEFAKIPDTSALVQPLQLAKLPPPIDEVAPNHPPSLLAICKCAMARDPKDRYADMLALADDLRAFLEQRPTSHDKGAWVELAKWVRRNRALAASWSAALLMITAGTLWFVLRLRGEIDAKERAFGELSVTTRERDRHNHRARAEKLIARASELFPATPEHAPAMKTWLDEVASLMDEMRIHDEPVPAAPGDSDASARLLAARKQLDDARTDVSARVQRARTLRARSVDAHADAWRSAIASIASSTRYSDSEGHKLEIVAQLGLVPLGENQLTGLHEFWVVDSGDRPSERGAQGHWRIGSSTGIVLVLLPGVRGFVMGSDDPRQDFDRRTCVVDLHPFFVSKDEVTQGQWWHVMGSRLAKLSSERPQHADHQAAGAMTYFDDRHPVESISLADAQAFCTRIDLRLPFEAQWEFAARAGTRSLFWMGDGDHDIVGRENIADAADGVAPGDGYRFHAPVGSFEANDFGLFDVHGNVLEWCREPYYREFGEARLSRGDGMREDSPAPADKQERLLRGGCFSFSHSRCGSASRGFRDGEAFDFASGFRVARPLWSCPSCRPEADRHE